MKRVLAVLLSLSLLYSLTAEAQSVANENVSASPAIDWNTLSPEQQSRFRELDAILAKYSQVTYRLNYLHTATDFVQKSFKSKINPKQSTSERNQVIAEAKTVLLDGVKALFSNDMTKIIFNDIAKLNHNEKKQFIAEVRPFIKSPTFNPEKSLLRKIIEHKEINEAVVAQECNQYMTGDGKKLYTSVRVAADEFEALISYIDAIRAAVKTGATQPSLTKK